MSDVSPLVFGTSFAVYTLVIVGVGIYSSRFAKRSNEDYFLADRSLGSWIAALSASASSESGWVTLGLVGWAFRSGLTAYWIIPGCLLGFMFNWWVIAGRMRERSSALGALTLPDFFSLNYNERTPILRFISVIVILTAMWLYVAAQFNAAGKSFAVAFDGLDYRIGVLIGATIVLAYTVIGGFRAACWTDFLQGLLMVGVLIVFPIYLLFNQGGWESILEPLSQIEGGYATSFWPEASGMALIGFLIGSGALGINLGYPGQPHVLVRFMALKEKRAAIVGGFISVGWATFVYFGAVTIGLIVRAMTEGGGAEWTAMYTEQLAVESTAGAAGDTGLVMAARHLIPGVMSGMVLAAVLAAICSTADSQLVVAASSGANDIYARLMSKAGARGQMLVNRLIVFTLGIGAVLLVIDQNFPVFKFVLDYGWAVLGAAFGPQVMLALLWKRSSYAGCIAGMVTGFVVSLGWAMFDMNTVLERVLPFEMYNLTVAFVLALVVNLLVSLAVPGPSAEGTRETAATTS